MHQTPALLLRRYRFSETSLIVVWLTKHYGKVKTIVRGATKAKGSFTGLLELFSEAEIAFFPSKKSDLHTLREVMPCHSEQKKQLSYLTLLTASYFVELCDLCTESMDPVPEIFGLLERALHFLNTNHPTFRALDYFETQLAKALGVYNPASSAEESLKKMIHRLPSSRSILFKQLMPKN